MTNSQEVPSAEALTPEQFLTELEATNECFPLIDGIFGAPGSTKDVKIANYHAPTIDFFNNRKLDEHGRGAIESPSVWMPLEISDDFKYLFDNGEEWFRVGIGAFLHFNEQRIPVKIIRLDFVDFTLTWLYRSEDNPTS